VKIAVLFGGLCLAFRKTMDFGSLWSDPRGLTGSELGAVRIAEELAALGHEVVLRTVSNDKEWHGVKIEPIDSPMGEFDAVIAINEPDLLRGVPATSFRVCMYWLNQTTHNRVGFHEWVDLFCSPSAAHAEELFNNPEWRKVETGPEFPDGKALYEPEPDKWTVVELGCDPWRYDIKGTCSKCGGSLWVRQTDRPEEPWCPPCGLRFRTDGPGHWYPETKPFEKIPGRVIYCSSPDRGLHWLLQEWPAIKRAVPHASLHIFYRLEPWLRGFDGTPYFPPIEPLRARANYVEECLRRFKEHGGLDVTLRDSVSRETIEREMAQAEVQAYPCDTTTWSEGFSCSILECCAARACPIITDCDALAAVYSDLQPTEMFKGKEPDGNWVPFWRDRVIRALTDETYRDELNAKAGALAERLTWRRTAERIAELIASRGETTCPKTTEETPTPPQLPPSGGTKPSAAKSRSRTKGGSPKPAKSTT